VKEAAARRQPRHSHRPPLAESTTLIGWPAVLPGVRCGMDHPLAEQGAIGVAADDLIRPSDLPKLPEYLHSQLAADRRALIPGIQLHPPGRDREALPEGAPREAQQRASGALGRRNPGAHPKAPARRPDAPDLGTLRWTPAMGFRTQRRYLRAQSARLGQKPGIVNSYPVDASVLEALRTVRPLPRSSRLFPASCLRTVTGLLAP
jgi:hypothetical protein